MTVLVDGRPPGLSAMFRPGNTFTLELAWPTGELADRTFTAALDATSLDVDIDDDTMTVTMTEAQSAAVTDTATFVLTETTGGIEQDLIVGRWTPADNAAASAQVDVTVAQGGASVDVTVTGGQRSAIYRINPYAPDGRDAADWTLLELSSDASMPDPPTVRYRRGRLEVQGSGALTSNSNRRDVLLAPGVPTHRNGRIRSVWHGTLPIAGQAATIRPQHGHGHRIVVDDDGTVRGAFVTHDIIFGILGLLNVNTLGGSGGSLLQGSGAAVLHEVAFTGGSRSSNVVTLTGLPTGHDLRPGDIIVVDASDNTYDGSFTVTSVATNSVTYGQVATDDASSGSGTIRPVNGSTLGNLFPSMGRQAAVSAAARASGVVTATVPSGHGYAPGDVLTVDLSDNTFDGIFTCLSVTSTTVTWTQAGDDDASGGTGTITRWFPYVVETQMIDDVLIASAWPFRQGAWTDAIAGPTWPSVVGDPLSTVAVDLSAVTTVELADRGRSGVFVGHTASTSMCRFSNLEFEVYS